MTDQPRETPESTPAEEDKGLLTRRQALVGAAALAATGGAAWSILNSLDFPFALPKLNLGEVVRLTPDPDGRVALAFADYPRLLRPLEPYSVRVPETHRIKWTLVWREAVSAGEASAAAAGASFRALSQVCTHASCAVELRDAAESPPGGELLCLCHNSRFALDGRPLGGPATLPLEQLRVEADGEGVRFFVD